MGELVLPPQKPEQYYVDKMTRKMENSILTARVKRQNYFTFQWLLGTACLLRPGKILFFEDKNIQDEFSFSLNGAGC